MGHVLPAFRSSLGLTARNPLHVVVVFVVGLFGGLGGLLISLLPLVGPLLQNVVVVPLMLAGLLGSANAVRRGESPFDGVGDGLSEASLSLMGAYALVWVCAFVLSLIAVVVGVVGAGVLGVGAQAYTPPAGEASTALPFANGLVFLFVFVIAFVVASVLTLTLQFVGPAAVVAGTGAVESVKSSFRLFRYNAAGVVGFSLLGLAVMAASLVVPTAAYVVGTAVSTRLVGAGLGVLGYLLALGVVGSFMTVYQVSYFAAVADDRVLPEGVRIDDDGDEAVGGFSAVNRTAGESEERGDTSEGGKEVGDVGGFEGFGETPDAGDGEERDDEGGDGSRDAGNGRRD